MKIVRTILLIDHDHAPVRAPVLRRVAVGFHAELFDGIYDGIERYLARLRLEEHASEDRVALCLTGIRLLARLESQTPQELSVSGYVVFTR